MLYTVEEMLTIANGTLTEYQNELITNPENAVKFQTLRLSKLLMLVELGLISLASYNEYKRRLEANESMIVVRDRITNGGF